MSEQNIVLYHKVRDNECMWSGIEDMFCDYSKQTIPDAFFLAFTGMGNFIYEKGRNQKKKLVQWNGGKVKDMYRMGADIIGYDYTAVQAATSEEALAFARERIELGNPVTLGCVDLYEIPYFKSLYKKVHIPGHYVMLTGYNEEEKKMYLLDGGKEELQALSYEILERAMKTEGNFQDDVNVLYQFQFHTPFKEVRQIAEEGFHMKAKTALEGNDQGRGIAGMHLLAKEFSDWKKECSDKEYVEALHYMLQFAGDVPSLPGRLEGRVEESRHWASRKRLANVLSYFSETLDHPDWKKAADTFLESGALIAQMVEQITSYLLNEINGLEEIPGLIDQIADKEEQAYTYLLKK
ncbi:MAG: BtrH N-terminal domain-containing protein [bacterium]|nr:BtrH N-terminal domain-containing protein [bacterium]